MGRHTWFLVGSDNNTEENAYASALGFCRVANDLHRSEHGGSDCAAVAAELSGQTHTHRRSPVGWRVDRCIKAVLVSDGSEPVGNMPDEFAAIIKTETAKWTKVIKSAGIKAE